MINKLERSIFGFHNIISLYTHNDTITACLNYSEDLDHQCSQGSVRLMPVTSALAARSAYNRL